MSVHLHDKSSVRFINQKERLCIFCYKYVVKDKESFHDDGDKAQDEQIGYINKFMEFLERFVGLSRYEDKVALQKLAHYTMPKSQNEEGRLGSCQDCETIISAVCSLYHQCRYLELQLEWKVKTLVDIMRSANRVSSRIQQLNDTFKGTKNSSQIEVDDASSRYNLASFKESRNTIIKRCNQKLCKSAPHVRLTRLDVGLRNECSPQKLYMNLKCENNLVDNNLLKHINTDGVANFLGWSISFAAVVLLSSFFDGVATSANFVPFTFRDVNTVVDFETDDKYKELQGTENKTAYQPVSLSTPRNDLGSFDAEKSQVSNGCDANHYLATREVAMEEDDVVIEKKVVLNNVIISQTETLSANDIIPGSNEVPKTSQMDLFLDNDFQQDNYTSSSSSEDETDSKFETKSEITVAATTINHHAQSTGNPSVPCTICFKIMKRSSLGRHTAELHSTCIKNKSQLRYYHCKICRKTLKRYETIIKHKMSQLHRKRRKLLIKKQRHLSKKMMRGNSESSNTGKSLKEVCGEDFDRREEDFSSGNVATAEQRKQISCPVTNHSYKEFATERGRQTKIVDGTSTEQIFSPIIQTSKEKIVQEKKSDKLLMIPNHENQKRSYCGMVSEDNDKEKNRRTNSPFNVEHNSKSEDDEKSLSAQFDQDKMSSVHSSEISDSETESDGCIYVNSEKVMKEDQSGPYNINFPYKCKYCKKVFNKYTSMSTHMQQFHKLSNKFICKIKHCGYRFKAVQNLEDHKKLHGKFQCNFCDVVKCFAPDLSLHELEHSVRPECTSQQEEKVAENFNCPRCLYTCGRESSYINHHLKSHINLSRAMHTCSICKAEGMSRKFPETHFKIHHKTDGLDSSQIFKCDQCPAYFIKIEQLNPHKMRIHNNGSSKCPICFKALSCWLSLRFHLERKHPDGFLSLKFPCDFPSCRRRYSSQLLLDNHIRCHKSNNSSCSNEMVGCSSCGKEFKGEAKLKMHMERVHVAPSFVCSKCGKAFKTKSSFKTHMDFHNPESWKFQCSTCEKKLINKTKLDEHVRTHTKEKPFICQICGERYAHHHNWRNHMKCKHPDTFDKLGGIVDNMSVKEKGNYLSRKGSKRGDFITAGTKV